MVCVAILVGSSSAGAQASSASSAATRVEGVAAAIGGTATERAEVILLSDVELRARMWLLGRDPEQALHRELPRGLLSAALRELIGEHLIAREAERVQVSRPTAAGVAEERLRTLISAGGVERVSALLARLGASSSELDASAERRALVGAFLRANLEGTTVITDREIDQGLASGGVRYAGVPSHVARAEVRAALSRAALGRNIERWVRVLRSRVSVRVYAAFEAR